MLNPNKKLSFDDLVEGPYYDEVIQPFIQGVYGKDLSPTQTVDLFLEHKRKFRIGSEMTVFGDLSYVRDTNKVNDLSYEDRIINYNAADGVFNAYEGSTEVFDIKNPFSGRTSVGTMLDYAEGFVKSPSLYIGLLIGAGSGKVAQMAASRFTQEAIKQYAKSQGKKIAANRFGESLRKQVTANFGKDIAKQQAIKAGAFEAGIAGLTDVGMQSVEKETGRRTSYNPLRTAGMVALAGGVAGGITYPLAKWQATKAATLQNDLYRVQFTKNKLIASRKKDVVTSTIRAKQVKKITEAIKRPIDRLFKPIEGSKESWEELTAKGQAMLSKIFGDSSFTHAQVRREINENLAYAVEEILSQASAAPDKYLTGLMQANKAISRGRINKIFEIDNPDKFTQKIFTAIGRGDIDTTLVQKTMEDFGLSVDDFRVMWWSTISEAGRTLGLWGNVARRLKMSRKQIEKSVGDVEGFTRFEKAGKEGVEGLEKIAGWGTNTSLRAIEEESARYAAGLTGRSLFSTYRQADNFRRAMMVSQPKTFVRNALSVSIRLPMDAGARYLDNAAAFFAMRADGALGKADIPVTNVNMSDGDAIFKWLINNQAAGTAINRLLKHIGEDSRASLSFLADYSEITRIASQKEGRGVFTSKLAEMSQGAADAVNYLNKTQEMMFRRGAFMGSIERQLGRMGIIGKKKIVKGKEVKPQYETLSDFIADGGFEKTAFWTNKDTDIIGRAMDDAMEFTFQGRATGGKIGSKTAEQGYVKQGWDHFGKFMVDAISNPKGLSRGLGTSIIPFPRFLYNAIKFQLEYSPLGLIDAISSDVIRASRRKFVEGRFRPEKGLRDYDFSEYGKGIMGFAMFGAAWKYRKSKYAGARWDEHKNERGESVNLAPLGPPVAPYLFTADVIDKWYQPNTVFNRKEANRILAEGGDLSDLEDARLLGGGPRSYRDVKEFLREAIKAGIGTQARVGPFSSALDELIINKDALEDLTPDKKVRAMDGFFKFYEKLSPFIGEYLTGFLMPFQVMSDIASTINPEEDIVRETKLAGPVLGKVKAKIPNFAQKLLGLRIEPARVDPFTGGIIRKKSGIPGQLTGLQVSRGPKTPEFAESQRLGLAYKEMVAFNEDPSLDYAFRQAYGSLLAAYRPSIESGWYAELPDVKKLQYWKTIIIPSVRDKARDVMKNKYTDKMYPHTNYYNVIHEIEKAFPTTEDRRVLEAYGGFEVLSESIGTVKEAREKMEGLVREEEESRTESERKRIEKLLSKLR